MSVVEKKGVLEEESQRILFTKMWALEEVASIASIEFKHKYLQAGLLVSEYEPVWYVYQLFMAKFSVIGLLQVFIT